MFKIQGIFPYIIALFINAFVDLGHKIIIQNTIFKLYDNDMQIILTAIVNALVLLPFILLFSPSGYLANKYPKNLIMKYSALAAIIITSGITFSYYMGWFWVAFFFTFLLAMQSSIYSPAKYAYIKELVGSRYISSGNAAVQGTTTVAILTGIIFFTVLFEMRIPSGFTNANDILQEMVPLGFILVGSSVIEFYLVSRLLNKSHASENKRFDFKKYRSGVYLQKNLKTIRRKKEILFAVIALSIFWSISQVLLAVFGAYAKESLHITNTIVVQGVMALAAIGIVIGSITAAKISKYYIHTGLVPLGAFGFSIVTLALPFSSNIEFVALLFFSFGFFAGLFLVPLNAYIQEKAPNAHLGTILAANNYFQNIFMFLFLVFTTLIAYLSVDVFFIFILMSIFGLLLAAVSFHKYIVMMIWTIMELVLSLRYKFIFEGLENLEKEGAVLYLGNHVSWIDWFIVHIPQQREVNFVMDREYYNLPVLHYIFKRGGAIPISNRSARSALQQATKCLKKREAVVIFPEGSITHSGEIGKFYKGFEKICESVEDGKIVPFYISGMYGSRVFSRSKKFQIKRAFFRREVKVIFSQALSIQSKAEDVKSVVDALEIKNKNFT